MQFKPEVAFVFARQYDVGRLYGFGTQIYLLIAGRGL